MTILKCLAIASVLIANTSANAVDSKPTDITVYRSPSCSCCGKWLEHLRSNNFNVNDIMTEDVQTQKNKYSVIPQLSSCHTAIVNGYVVEGHVPAEDIVALLKNKPKVVGLSVPGMPVGTPGMDMGTKKDSYDVVSFDDKKQATVFHHYKGNQ